MNLQVGNYRIVRSDPLNLALEQRKVVGKARNPYGRKGRQEGQEKIVAEEASKKRWVHIGWYGHLEASLNAMLKQMIETRLKDDAEGVQQIIDTLETAKEEIKKEVQTQLAQNNE